MRRLALILLLLGGCARSDDNDSIGFNSFLIASITPEVASSSGGTIVVIITGGFQDDFTVTLPMVTFGGVAPLTLVANNGFTLTATVPPLAPGFVNVQVTDSMDTGIFVAFEIVAPIVAGDLLINEGLLSPGGVDANRDGAADNADDEFIELVNLRGTPVDLSGSTLSNGGGVVHVFPNPTTVPENAALVIFGGGSVANFPPLHANGAGQTASTGSLGLNDAGDTVTLDDSLANLIDSVVFPAATAGTSHNRNPDGGAAAPLALHTAIPGNAADPTTGADLSPGVRVTQAGW